MKNELVQSNGTFPLLLVYDCNTFARGKCKFVAVFYLFGIKVCFRAAETGRLKTDLGECNLNVTRLVDKCCKIVVSITLPCYEQIT